MADPKLVSYIKTSLDNGVKKEEVNSILIDAGWAQPFIDEGFKEAKGERHVNTVGTDASDFGKLRTWLMALIGVRLVIMLLDYLLLPLLIQSDYESYFDYLTWRAAGSLLVPLLWILPLWFIWKRKKIGYVFALLFGIVLILINISGSISILFNFNHPAQFLSVAYVALGTFIVFLSSKSFKYFSGSEVSAADANVNKIWTKRIPIINKIFLIPSLVLVFGLDALIVFGGGGSDYVELWAIMVGILTVFIVFFCFENYSLSKKFGASKSKLDPWISGLIIARNLIFIINFVPLIHLLMLFIMPVVAPVFLVLYAILIIARFNEAK